jgi:D-amino peptidase
MKVYISVDIEGSAGIAHWDEAMKPRPDYPEFRERMTGEAVAACEGALAAGATEIWVKDAHSSGRNIMGERLPAAARLIRGWSGHPFAMLQELDESFDAAAFVGWHGPATHPANPLSHTMTGTYGRVTLNGELCSEYLFHAHVAALVGVPVVFLSGDSGICALARATNPAIHTVETNRGEGDSVVAIQPGLARERIRESIEAALRSDRAGHVQPRSERYELAIRFSHHTIAYRKAFYPGARLDDPETLVFESDDFFEVARLLKFMSG